MPMPHIIMPMPHIIILGNISRIISDLSTGTFNSIIEDFYDNLTEYISKLHGKCEILLLGLILIGPSIIPSLSQGAGESGNSAYADQPTTLEKGNVKLVGKIVVSHLGKSKITAPPVSIPLRKPGIEAPEKGGGGPAAQVPLSTTSGLKSLSSSGSISGLGYDNVTPPDVQIAAGPVNIMEMVNLQGQVWTKAGASQLGPFALTAFFTTGSSDFISDPKVLFDSNSNAWFASITDITTSSVNIAVSTTNDATGTFCVYVISGSSGLILDQPIIGVSDDKFVVSVNNFRFSGAFKNAEVWVLNKSQLTSCSISVNAAYFTTTSYFSIHPAQSLTSTSTEYLVSTSRSSSGSFANVFAVNGVPPNTVTASVTNIHVSTISTPPAAIQHGTTYKLDTGDYRVQDAAWASGNLWLDHNNKCTPSGDTSSRACIHLLEITTGTMQVQQDFNYGVSGKYVFYPALRILSSGSLVVVYGLSSSIDYPGILVTEQATTDPKGSLQTPVSLQQGKSPVTLTYGCSNGVCRYGDYFGAGLDPSVSSGFWVAGEYGSGVVSDPTYGWDWATQIGSFTG